MKIKNEAELLKEFVKKMSYAHCWKRHFTIRSIIKCGVQMGMSS